jgi:hypothetical protein
MKGRGFDRRHFSCNFNAIIHRRPCLKSVCWCRNSTPVALGTVRVDRQRPRKAFRLGGGVNRPSGMHCVTLATVLHYQIVLFFLVRC